MWRHCTTGMSILCLCTSQSVDSKMCRAHAAKVRSLWWSPDDTTLLTCGADGAVFQWRVAGLARLKDFTLQAWRCSCMHRIPCAC